MDLSSVRIREHYGLASNNTHTGQFTFLVSPPKNKASLEKYDYVLVDHPILGDSCQVLAVISEITSYEEVAGSTLGDKMGKLLATADILGYVDLKEENKPLKKALVPPNPGCRIYVPLKKFLEDTLNRNAKGQVFQTPIQLGMFEASSAEDPGNYLGVKCFVDAQDFTSKHTIISAAAGAGKTHTAKLLIQELTGKTSTQIVLFDPYNEYQSGFGGGKSVEVDAKMGKDALTKELKRGQLTIANAQGLTLEEKKVFYTDLLQLLTKLRLEGKIKPLLLVIEEAESLRGEALSQVVVEGRKIGIFVCLVTTHPVELGGKILSQMGNQIIGKTTDKEDMEYLANMVGPANNLSTLTFGEWIINGVNASRPMKVQIN